MAELPPWLNVGPENYLRAAVAGGEAGLRARAEANQAAEEQARLTNEQAMAKMQADVRKQVLQQQMLRQQQMIEMNKAYKEAQVGLAQDRLQRQQVLDQEKA